MKKFEVKAKSPVQLIRSDGIILKPTDGIVILDVDTETDQMEELVRAKETGLITLEEVKVGKKKASPKKFPKSEESKVTPEEKIEEPPKEELTETPPDKEDEGAPAELEKKSTKKSTRKKAADKKAE